VRLPTTNLASGHVRIASGEIADDASLSSSLNRDARRFIDSETKGTFAMPSTIEKDRVSHDALEAVFSTIFETHRDSDGDLVVTTGNGLKFLFSIFTGQPLLKFYAVFATNPSVRTEDLLATLNTFNRDIVLVRASSAQLDDGRHIVFFECFHRFDGGLNTRTLTATVLQAESIIASPSPLQDLLE
jgi:hypothetical protein